MNLKVKKKVAEYLGYTVMPYNKYMAKHCGEGETALYKYNDTMCLFDKELLVGNPNGYVNQLKCWHPDLYWPTFMEVATFMVKQGLPVNIVPDLTPAAAFKDLMKTLKKYL